MVGPGLAKSRSPSKTTPPRAAAGLPETAHSSKQGFEKIAESLLAAKVEFFLAAPALAKTTGLPSRRGSELLARPPVRAQLILHLSLFGVF